MHIFSNMILLKLLLLLQCFRKGTAKDRKTTHLKTDAKEPHRSVLTLIIQVLCIYLEINTNYVYPCRGPMYPWRGPVPLLEDW